MALNRRTAGPELLRGSAEEALVLEMSPNPDPEGSIGTLRRRERDAVGRLLRTSSGPPFVV